MVYYAFRLVLTLVLYVQPATKMKKETANATLNKVFLENKSCFYPNRHSPESTSQLMIFVLRQ